MNWKSKGESRKNLEHSHASRDTIFLMGRPRHWLSKGILVPLAAISKDAVGSGLLSVEKQRSSGGTGCPEAPSTKLQLPLNASCSDWADVRPPVPASPGILRSFKPTPTPISVCSAPPLLIRLSAEASGGKWAPGTGGHAGCGSFTPRAHLQGTDTPRVE
ncbi:hypothetical protein P7K49_015357 [Saguinus oedipus]|uniref:Uncharacterized protein n=1 Tax=Saguinus oedipus TaxID=9490 RepID=A0ABQ9V924_SAGOE|nr:hypothetical protein P7K49_015357 [Saguinus oedipus]